MTMFLLSNFVSFGQLKNRPNNFASGSRVKPITAAIERTLLLLHIYRSLYLINALFEQHTPHT